MFVTCQSADQPARAMSSVLCPQNIGVWIQAVGKDTIKDLHAPESILKGLGANYSKAPADWGPHVEIDSSGSGPLVTGGSFQFLLQALLYNCVHI